MNITLGLKFTSKHFKGICEVIDVQENKNSLSVMIHRHENSHQEDDWNLQHTIWGFENEDYIAIDTTKHLTNKHGQLENDGAYAD